MTTTLDSLPKPVRELPEDAQTLWAQEYNRDFAWQCQEAHAEKAAWNAVRRAYRQTDDGWVRK